MELLGDKAWYMPKWLDRILPHISIEGPPDEEFEAEHPGQTAQPELVGVGQNGRSTEL